MTKSNDILKLWVKSIPPNSAHTSSLWGYSSGIKAPFSVPYIPLASQKKCYSNEFVIKPRDLSINVLCITTYGKYCTLCVLLCKCVEWLFIDIVLSSCTEFINLISMKLRCYVRLRDEITCKTCSEISISCCTIICGYIH